MAKVKYCSCGLLLMRKGGVYVCSRCDRARSTMPVALFTTHSQEVNEALADYGKKMNEVMKEILSVFEDALDKETERKLKCLNCSNYFDELNSGYCNRCDEKFKEWQERNKEK